MPIFVRVLQFTPVYESSAHCPARSDSPLPVILNEVKDLSDASLTLSMTEKMTNPAKRSAAVRGTGVSYLCPILHAMNRSPHDQRQEDLGRVVGYQQS